MSREMASKARLAKNVHRTNLGRDGPSKMASTETRLGSLPVGLLEEAGALLTWTARADAAAIESAVSGEVS